MQRGAPGCYNGVVAISSVPAGTGVRGLIARVAYVMRRIIGAPDYDRYLAHVRVAHPGDEPVSEQEFVRRQMDRRGDPGSRCC